MDHLVKVLRDEFRCTYYSDPRPLPPWRLTVVSSSGNQLQLDWDPLDEEDVTSIKIYRAVNNGPYQLFNTLSSEARQFLDDDITPGTTYKYRLACVDLAGQESDYSRSLRDWWKTISAKSRSNRLRR
jgi:hypothetical protein